MAKLAYRPDIDGLRAVAVLPVVLYHAFVPGFTGGYVGVDIFFVISGYLITGILMKDHEANRQSLVNFYERRVRRIMPALITMLALALFGGFVILLPASYAALAKSAISVLAFASNFYFWRGEGYFSDSGDRPLLHTWSLAVEEQFYIFFPLMLWLLLRLNRRLFATTVWVLIALSLGLAVLGTYLSPSATFFLLPTRAWELFLGAVLAAGMVPKVEGRRLAAIMVTAGLVAIALSISLYDSQTLFPGLAAIPPCLGAALVIHGGSVHQTAPSRLLQARLLVGIGLVSYSLYLFHFPLLVYAHKASTPATADLWRAAGVAGSIVAAWLSWRFIERPFRELGRFSRKEIFTWAGIASAAIGALALAIVALQGVPQRFDARGLSLAAGANDHDAASRACINADLAGLFTGTTCRIGNMASTTRSTSPDFVVWGDSHAAALVPALNVAAEEAGARGLLASFNACPPLLDYRSTALSWKDADTCIARNRDFVNRINANSEVHTVILAGYWGAYLEQIDNHGKSGDLTARIVATLDALKGKQVIVMLDTPTSAEPLPARLAIDHQWGRQSSALPSNSSSPSSLQLRKAIGGRARIVDLSALVCKGADPCPVEVDGHVLLSDGNHISKSAAKDILGPALSRENLFDAKAAHNQHSPATPN